MAPKGATKPPSQLGIIQSRKGGFRVQVLTAFGPHRQTEDEAKNDLLRARRCTSREEMIEFVRELANCVEGADSQKLFPGAQDSECISASQAGGQATTCSSSTSFEDCQKILEGHREHIAALELMLPDVKTKPSDSRIRELAERLKVPKQVDRHTLPLDLVFQHVQQQFRDEVCKLQSNCPTMSSINPAPKKARVATAVAGSGGPHSAAPSNRVDEVSAVAKQPPSHAGRVLNTGSSDVAQLTATCQEPRSAMVFIEILEPIWAIEVADGQKMFECIANRTKWHNQSKPLASGDLIVIVVRGRDKVSAVCEVASPATVKETTP